MYGVSLSTAENRQKVREIFLKGFVVQEYPEYNCTIGTQPDKLEAIAFKGTAGKPTWHYKFESAEKMQEYIDKYLKEQKDNIEYNQERKNKRKAPALSTVPYKPGDILYDSWGYEQTNIDFYEVIEVRSASTIVIREIDKDIVDATGLMSGHVTPSLGEYIEEPIIKRIRWYGGKPYIKSEYGSIGRWDGKPISCSWYA